MKEPITEPSYSQHMSEWNIKYNRNCSNYVTAKAWALDNGFELADDISYNGYIKLQKTIGETENSYDGHKLEIQVYDGIIKNSEHWFQQYDKHAEFGKIMDPITYHYTHARGPKTNFDSFDLGRVFEFTLQRESELKMD
jgi:hypothetical protein